jgi:signal transduction histidine kinase
MARLGQAADALIALGRRVKALVQTGARRTPQGIGPLAGRFEDVLRLLERDARLNADLLAELREATRLGESALTRPSSRIDLAEVVRSTTESLAALAREHGVTLEARCAATSLIIQADAQYLTHVVGRLLASAIALSSSGSTVGCELSLSADWIGLLVRAPGGQAGLLQSSWHRDPTGDCLQVAHEAAWEQLGLATVRALVEREGGAVRIESRESDLIFALILPGDARARTPG